MRATFSSSTMSPRLPKHSVRAMLLALGCLTVAVTSVAQERSAPRREESPVPADVRAAHLFVLAAYPDLVTRPITVSLTPLNGQVVVRVVDATPPGPSNTDAAPLVSAVVAFDAAGRVTTYAATGALLEDTRNRAFLQEMAAHPEWSEADAEGRLDSLGGRSTARPSPGSTPSETKWRTFLGVSVSAAPARLRWKGDPSAPRAASVSPATLAALTASQAPGLPPPPTLAIKPAWIAEITAETGGPAPARYRVEYEPFGGRLIAVVRQ